MGKLSLKDAVTVGVPPAMRDKFIVRITEMKFAPSSKGNPMLTIRSEIAGVPTSEGIVDSVQRGGKTYKVAGLRCQPVYLTLVAGQALGRVHNFLRAADWDDNMLDNLDDENFDVQPFIGMCFNAIVNGREEVTRKILTDEDRAAGKTQGDPILDDDNNPIKKDVVVIEEWLSKYTGQLPF